MTVFYKEDLNPSEITKDQLRGYKCTCCGHLVKVYKRPLTSSMAAALIIIYEYFSRNEETWMHVENYLKNIDCPASIRGDFPKLRFWGFITPHPSKEGYYTHEYGGYSFVNGNTTASACVYIKNDQLLASTARKINIRQALKNKFDYDKLMKGEF